MGKKSAPDPPDYSPIADAYRELGDIFGDLQQDQLDWAKVQNDQDRKILREVLDVQLPLMREQAQQASQSIQRYNETFLPIEDQFIEDALDYATPERQQAEAERAMQDVNAQFETQRENALRQLEGYGVDPSTTRSQALDLGTRVTQAAAAAQAGNQARRQTEMTGLQLQGDVVNLGRGVPSQTAQSAGTALSAGNAAQGNTLNTSQTFMGALGSPAAYSSPQLGAVGGQLNTLNSQYNANLNQWKANQQSRSGIGDFLGGVGSVAGFALGPAPTGGFSGTMLGSLFNEGGAVPDEISPSRGALPDDVPARLTAGEFIIPDDVVRRKGEEFFERLVEGTRKKALPVEEQERANG